MCCVLRGEARDSNAGVVDFMTEDQVDELLTAVSDVIDEYYSIKSSLPLRLDDAINELIIVFESLNEEEDDE
jgi:hypothetical protein